MSAIPINSLRSMMPFIHRLYLCLFLTLFASTAIATTPGTVQPIAAAITVTDDLLSWTSTGAVAINVHRGHGEWLASLPGHATTWQASAPGEYYLVSTTRGPWQEWPRSETVRVVKGGFDLSNPDDNADDLTIRDQYAKVYSSTAIELFWNLPNSRVTKVEVFRDDGLSVFVDGTSFYDGFLEPDTEYYYSLFPYDERGNLGEIVYIDVKTAGMDGVGFADPAGPDSTPVPVPVQPQPTTPISGNIVVVGAPVSVQGRVYGETTAEIIWLGVASEHTLMHYQVFQDGELVHTTSGHSYFMNDLQPGTQYTFFINALRNDGTETIGITQTITSAGSENEVLNYITVVNAPIRVGGGAYSETTAEILWPGDGDENTFIEYQVFRDDELVHTTTGHSFYMDDLQPGTSYNFYVNAVRFDGSETEGVSHQITTPGNGIELVSNTIVVNAPLSVGSTVYSSTSAELIWPGGSSENTFVEYQVFRNGVLEYTTKGHSYLITDLQPGTLYTYYVNALRIDGETTGGIYHSFTTPE